MFPALTLHVPDDDDGIMTDVQKHLYKKLSFDADEVAEGLFVGAARSVAKADELASRKIHRVINLSGRSLSITSLTSSNNNSNQATTPHSAELFDSLQSHSLPFVQSDPNAPRTAQQPSTTATVVEVTSQEALQILNIQVHDRCTENIAQHFSVCWEFINGPVPTKDDAVLVVCKEGTSRSVTVVAAYLMKRRQWSCMMALAHIQQSRPVAAPNIFFLAQLYAYEKSSFTYPPTAPCHEDEEWTQASADAEWQAQLDEFNATAAVASPSTKEGGLSLNASFHGEES